MRKTQIAVIGLKGLPAFGGAATVGENTIEQLKEEFDFTVYAVASHTDKKGYYNGYQQIVFNNFPIKALNIFAYYLKSMFHCLFAANYDIIHLHHLDGAFIVPFLRLKYKVVSTSHGRTHMIGKWPFYVKIFFRFNEWLMLKLSNKVTAVALPLLKTYQRLGYKNVEYIPNGISLDQPISEQSLNYNDYILFAAGRILPIKGCHVLMEALHKMNYKGKLLVIGDLDQLPEYKEKILHLSSALDTTFLPLIREKDVLLNYVRKAKLFVFPSEFENMSIMMLEVAYTKTALICSDIEENKAVFSNNEVLFFKTNDSDDLKQKMEYALANPDKMKDLALQAYRILESQYNWTTIASSYSKLYNQL